MTDPILSAERIAEIEQLFKQAMALSPTENRVARELLASHKAQAELLVKEGPLNSERWTLDELMAQLQKWKAVAGGQTCVSFESLCFGASSLWHQIHRENFRKVDRKPAALSRWVLEHHKSVRDDFPEQVLEILEAQAAKLAEVQALLDADMPSSGIVGSLRIVLSDATPAPSVVEAKRDNYLGSPAEREALGQDVLSLSAEAKRLREAMGEIRKAVDEAGAFGDFPVLLNRVDAILKQVEAV